MSVSPAVLAPHDQLPEKNVNSILNEAMKGENVCVSSTFRGLSKRNENKQKNKFHMVRVGELAQKTHDIGQ